MGGLEREVEVAPQLIVFSLHRRLPNRAETLTQWSDSAQSRLERQSTRHETVNINI